MASKSVGGSANAHLIQALADALSGGLLPGETPFTPQALAEAALFLLDAAAQRDSSEASIRIESISGSASERFMRIAVINDDMPFLVDSIAGAVAGHGIAVDRLIHPVLAVRRDAGGALTGIVTGEAAGERRESLIYLETRRGDARLRRALESALKSTLADVKVAVSDWPRMQTAMAVDADTLSDSEGAALLRWFQGGALTQLGHVTRRRDGSQEEALGICKRSAKILLGAISWDRAFAWFDKNRKGARPPLVVKSNTVSQVHRRVPLDLFITPVLENGKVEALSVHAGLWTSAALGASPSQIPRLRSQLTELMTRLGFSAQGHAGKALVHALTALPHDLLIGCSDDDLQRIATTMMSLIDRPRPRLALVPAALDRHLFAFVWLPRDGMSTATRLQIEAMLVEACDAPVLDWSLEIEGSLALLRYVLDLPEVAKIPDEQMLDERLQAMLRGWTEAVESEIAEGEEAMRAAAIASRFAEAFPLAYRSLYGPAEAACDIARLRGLGDNGARGARLLLAGDELRLKLYQNGGAIALSDAVPALENFGFHVVEDVPTELDGGKLGTIHDFHLTSFAGQDDADLMARAEVLENAVAEVLNGAAEDDPFNRLISVAALSAQETNWLRAWYRYLRQAGLNYGIPTVVDALQHAPTVTRGLIALFVARHDPAFKGDRSKAESAAQGAIREGLAKVTAINDDRLLRQYRALIEAMLRTNAFAPAATGALAFKLDSAAVPGLPKPVPYREIFVYSRRVEGIHLRAGPIARGGLRWSDRRDDFRTEVLGLMKAQRTKNAVIVPTGAKGGFYPKQLPDPARDREGWLAEGKDSYKLFIRTLLSLTDNIVGGKVIHPKGVTIRDDEDPYFVVAADKGTATFSDTANAIADEHDFWLDDAFASGGSKGYDHKAMGITAKGAWLSVQRHFLEIGIDVQNVPVRVAGCGDMSGDVFGNGMLLSRHIRLVAAFDHRHIFLDPNPDAARSFVERERMFKLQRSSWAEYDASLLSSGGGIHPRSAKSIPITPEARAALGISADALTPTELVNAILKAPVDLIYNGGIGTYVKASGESHAQVGDRASDAVRVNGGELRCRVFCEGGNLGCTQLGRIEFALAGGRINTDAIDNSAGVDTSDHEVNIKILLGAPIADGEMTEKQRNSLLPEMTEEVASLVLRDNVFQTQVLSVTGRIAPQLLDAQTRFMQFLEKAGRLNRAIEFLPSDAQIAERRAQGLGLTSPEHAVVLAYSKIWLYDELLASTLPDDPWVATALQRYFPRALTQRFAGAMLQHPLKREIIATYVTNSMVNRVGSTFVHRLLETTGAHAHEVVRAYLMSREIFGLVPMWQEIEALNNQVADQVQSRMLIHTSGQLERGATWFLRSRRLGDDIGATVAHFRPDVEALSARLTELQGADERARVEAAVAAYVADGVPQELATRVVTFDALHATLDIAEVAGTAKQPVGLVAAIYFDVGNRLGMPWLREKIAALPGDQHWRMLAKGAMLDDLSGLQRAISGVVLAAGSGSESATLLVENWQLANQRALERATQLLAELRAVPTPDSAMLSVTLRELRALG